MKVLEWDEKHGIMKVHVDNEDDLWVLNLVIEKGDEVVARTTRDVSVGKESRRVPMVVKILVEKTEFQTFTNRLRISGVIEEAPERFGIKGSHHTVNVDVGDELVIIKKKWNKFAINKIFRQAEPRVKVLLALVDYDEYLIALPYSQGVKILAERSMRTPSKNEPELVEENAEEVAKEIESYVKQNNVEVVVLAGPGPFKEEVAKRLKNIKLYVDSTSSATRSGLNELLRRDVMDRVMRDYELSVAVRVLDQIMANISKGNGLAAYGIDEVEKAAEMGAISDLLVSEDLLIVEDDQLRERVENVMNRVEETSGKVWIVPKESDVFFQVKNFGGLLALLRFRIQ